MDVEEVVRPVCRSGQIFDPPKFINDKTSFVILSHLCRVLGLL